MCPLLTCENITLTQRFFLRAFICFVKLTFQLLSLNYLSGCLKLNLNRAKIAETQSKLESVLITMTFQMCIILISSIAKSHSMKAHDTEDNLTLLVLQFLDTDSLDREISYYLAYQKRLIRRNLRRNTLTLLFVILLALSSQ